MYSIAEKKIQTGNIISRDNGRLWIGRDGNSTPAADEAQQFESRSDAEAFALLHGIELGAGSWWMIVDLDAA